MKQSIIEAAYDYATEKTKFRKDVLKEVDADNYVSRHADSMEDFQCGVQWKAEQSPWISVEMAIPKDDSSGVVQVRTVEGKEGEMAARRVVYNIYPYIKTEYVTHWRVVDE